MKREDDWRYCEDERYQCQEEKTASVGGVHFHLRYKRLEIARHEAERVCGGEK